MTINLMDARRGLHNKCLELFADKNIAEKIYRYLCDGIEDCEEAEPVKHGQWFKTGQSLVYPDKFRNYFCSVCGFELDNHIRQEPNYCPNCGARMGGVENGN